MWLKRFGLALSLAAGLVPLGASAYTYKVLHNFCSKRLCRDGNTPVDGLAMDASGTLYGVTTTAPGAESSGTAYALVPNADRTQWSSRTLASFPGYYKGVYLRGSPVLDVEGNLYGVANGGGHNNLGTVWELTSEGGHRQVKVLLQFDDTPDLGYSPSLLTYRGQASGALYDGVSPLYGATGATGPNNGGAAYSLTSQDGTWKADVLYAFCSKAQCSDGKGGGGSLLADGAGDLIGATGGGGTNQLGVVYKLADAGGAWNETVLHEFCTTDRCHDGYQSPGVTEDALGNLFGVGAGGRNRTCCGVAFEIASGGVYQVLYQFCAIIDCRDGAGPVGVPVMDSSGTLYGATQQGGGHNRDQGHAGGGTLYALHGTALTTLYSFCKRTNCLDGAYPTGSLVMDAGGNLFGTTYQGGKYNAGVVFELSP